MSSEDSSNGSDKDLTLSAALLAPLNSLFETQVHAARAFLNFILQLGFKEKYTKNDINKFETLINDDNSLTDDQKKERIDELEIYKSKLEYDELKSKDLSDLTDDEKDRLDTLGNLIKAHGLDEDVRNLKFKYKDGQGVERNIKIPSLAVVPVQPLAVKRAEFDYYMSVNNKYEDYNQQQLNKIGGSRRPWFFIQPKRMRGKIQSSEESQREAGIKIHVEVESAPIPQGLSNLLTSLTQSSRIDNDK